MNGADYLIGLGKVVANLHSLELLLRVFLCEANREHLQFPETSMKAVPETHLTNFMSLDQLIRKFNCMLDSSETAFTVDASVVRIRNALAHGRLTSTDTSFPLSLYKFGRPKCGLVPIDSVDIISGEWLKQSRQVIFSQMENVLNCAKARSYRLIKS